MVLSHYGIFVDLAGIRIDLESLSKNHHKTIDEYLSHWNTIRNIYSKMGDSIYKYKSFLGCVKKILDLKDNTIKDIITELEKDLEPIKNKRDYATHFHPLPFVLDEDDNMRFPRRLYDGNWPLPYSEIRKQDPKYWLKDIEEINSDLEEIERRFSFHHGLILDLFQKNKKFEIIYPESVSNMKEQSSTNSITGSSTFSTSSGDFT